MRSRLARLALCALLLLPATGCISERQEQELGDAMAEQINAQLPLVTDPAVNLYLNRVGTNLARVSERPEVDYRFYLIHSDLVNAFALPGGHIYITTGLIQQTRTGAELAGVLAHEIGHVAARHGVQKLQRSLRTGSVVSTLYHLILGGEPDILREDALRLGGALWSARHSREDEREADRLAVEYLTRAGIDPGAIISLLESMLAQGGQDSARLAAWFSTHPLTTERIALTEAEIAELEAAPGDAVSNLPFYSAFLRRIASIPGPSPPQ